MNDKIAASLSFRNFGFCLLVLALFFLSPMLPAAAQTYPQRTVKILAPYAAGSSSDVLARTIAQALQESLGAPFIVENKAGATGQIAASEVARAEPDGYTLLLAGISTHAINPYLYKSIPYDPVKDFSMITRLSLGQSVFAIPASMPINTVQELIAYAKAHPREIRYAAQNAVAPIIVERFKKVTGTDMVQVPYKTYADSVSDLVSGRIQLEVLDILNAVPLITSGQLKGLMITGNDPSGRLPGVPTAEQAGLKDFAMYAWLGLVGPPGMRTEVVDKLNGAVRDAMKLPAVLEVYQRLEYLPRPQTPGEMLEFVKDQLQIVGQVAKDAGIEPQ